MYSRLYTHILNHFPQIDHCASFHHIYTDSSLFGLFASFVPSSGRQTNSPAQILPHLVHQLSLLLYSNIPQAELGRAKNQLKSSLMMALESRAVEVEDLGRQVSTTDSVPATMTDSKFRSWCMAVRFPCPRCATKSTRSTTLRSAVSRGVSSGLARPRRRR